VKHFLINLEKKMVYSSIPTFKENLNSLMFLVFVDSFITTEKNTFGTY